MIYTNIKKYYNDRKILDIKSIEFKDGKIYGIKGRNGSGKTTFCRIIANIDNKNNDILKIIDNSKNIANYNNINNKNIDFDNKVIISKRKCEDIIGIDNLWNKNSKNNELSRNCDNKSYINNFNNKNIENNYNIGYMPQSSVVFDMKVIDNMMLNTDDKKKAMTLLKKYHIDNLAYKNAKTLSGGEKQKLCLARLMIKKYDMLILDEPTSSMDNESTKIAEKMIREYNKKYKSTIIIVSHEEGQLERLTKNIYRLENGKLKK